MAKNGYFWEKWEFEAWLSDPALGMCELATKGFWMEALCVMMKLSSDRIVGSYEQIARICRCSVDEARLAISDLQKTGAADVHENPDKSITLVNRRRSDQLSRSSQNQKNRKGSDDETVTKSSPKEKFRSSFVASPSNSNSSSVDGGGGAGGGGVDNGRNIPPAQNECTAYAAKLGMPESEGERFFNFYGSKGWKVGGSAMKNWHMAMANWKKGWEERGSAATTPGVGRVYAQPKSGDREVQKIGACV